MAYSHARTWVLLGIVSGMAGFAACSSSKKGGGGGGGTTPTATTTSTATATNPVVTPAPCSTVPASTSTVLTTSTATGTNVLTGGAGAGFGGTTLDLDATNPTYDDIAPLMTASCATAGCHVAGAQAPDLTTFIGVSANGPANLADMQATAPVAGANPVNPMPPPPAAPMTAEQIALFQAWVTAGMPQGTGAAAAGTTSTDPTVATTATPTVGASGDCTSTAFNTGITTGTDTGLLTGTVTGTDTSTSTATGTTTGGGWTPGLGLEGCNQTGKAWIAVANGGAGTCSTDALVSWCCSEAEILRRFPNVNGLKAALDQPAAQGLKLYNCSETTGKTTFHFAVKDGTGIHYQYVYVAATNDGTVSGSVPATDASCTKVTSAQMGITDATSTATSTATGAGGAGW